MFAYPHFRVKTAAPTTIKDTFYGVEVLSATTLFHLLSITTV